MACNQSLLTVFDDGMKQVIHLARLIISIGSTVFAKMHCASLFGQTQGACSLLHMEFIGSPSSVHQMYITDEGKYLFLCAQSVCHFVRMFSFWCIKRPQPVGSAELSAH